MKTKNLRKPFFTFTALAVAGILISTAARAELKTFTLDQSQSKLYFTGTVASSLGNGNINPQGSGSLTSSYTGTIEVNLDGSLIQFVGGSIIDGTVTGNWQPGVGGAPGVFAAADYGGTATVGTFLTVTAKAAIRETRFDVTNVSSTITAGAFPAADLRIFSPNTNLYSLMDYSYTGVASGSGQKPLAAIHTNAIANGTLVTQGAEQILTIPVDISGNVPAGGGTIINYRFRGPLVAKNFLQNLVKNGSFKSNAVAFTTFPGYTGGANPANITDWSNINALGVGLNGVGTTAGDAFGPTTAGGRTYAFIQGGVNGLSQDLPLTTNATYQLEYDVAVRAVNTANYKVEIVDATQTYFTSGTVAGNNAAFVHVTQTFTTSGALDGASAIKLWNLTSGDNTVDFANVTLVLLSTKSTTTTVFASSSNPTPYGDGVTLTATVTTTYGYPSGTVTFKDGVTILASVPLVNAIANTATAAVTFAQPPAASYNLTATYSGDASFAASASSLLVQVVNGASAPDAVTLVVASGGDAVLTYPGISGNKYSLERTFSLSPADWVSLTTNSAAINGYVMFTNAPQPGTNNFWRTRHVP